MRTRFIAHAGLACCLALLCSASGSVTPSAQAGAEAGTSDAEYRKLDALFSVLRARNVEQFAIGSAKGIDEASFITIGGLQQWVTVRGQDRDNALLLFLHGGPGDVTTPWAFAVFAPWEKHFTVVQWDQRGAGRTLKKNGRAIAPTLTVDRLVQDGIELAEHLRRHLHKDKIILVGHSFGSIVGVLMVRARPDLFSAYVGTGQVADSTRNYTVAYDALVKKARAMGDLRASSELSHVGPPPYASGEGYRVQRKWANAFEGADQFLFGTLGLSLVAPGNSAENINDSADGQLLSAERLVSQTQSLQPKDLGLQFSIPMFVIQGAEDFTTPTALAREYLHAMSAPRKAFVTITDGGHFAVFMRSREFLKVLVDKIVPLAHIH